MGSNVAGAMGETLGTFIKGRNDSRRTNIKGGDKYFHCRANCEATRSGQFGEAAASMWSDLREVLDIGNWRDRGVDAGRDQYANAQGRSGARRAPQKSCSEVCAHLRPRGVPPEY